MTHNETADIIVIGEALAQTVLGLEPRVPIDMYDITRFDEGKTLHGAYRIGSIS